MEVVHLYPGMFKRHLDLTLDEVVLLFRSYGDSAELDWFNLKVSSNPDFRNLQDAWALNLLPSWQYTHQHLYLLHP